MEPLILRIQKLLALGERAGTEAEAEMAMSKVHELLAKHNLSLDDIPDSAEADEKYEMTDAGSATLRQPWQDWIWGSVAKLYFCKHLKRTRYQGRRTISEHHLLVGKPSNIAAAKYIATYVIRTGEELARAAAAASDSKRTFINSFKKGFSHRIYGRVQEQMRKAMEGKISDSVTGNALILSPLYDRSASEIDRFLMEENIRPASARGANSAPNDHAGYAAGRSAAESIALANNGVGRNAVAAIPHFATQSS